MHKTLKIVGIIAILVLLISVAQASDWPMFHHDLRHTGYTNESIPDDLELLWSFETGAPVFSSPAVAESMIFIGSWDNKTYCLDKNTGKLIWSYETGRSVFSSPAVADGRVFVGSHDNKIYCLDENTGKLIWSYETGYSVVSSPAVSDGKVFVSSGGEIYGLDKDNGDLIWSYQTMWADVSSPAVADGKVFVGSSDGKLYCIDENTGKLIWSYRTGGSVYSSPAVSNGKVFVGSVDNKTYCLDEYNGKLIWSYETGDNVYSSPAVAEGKVFFGSIDNKTYCLDEDTGNFIWSYETGNWVFSSPAVADGKVFVGSLDNKIYCLDENTGNLIWSYETGNYIKSSPAVADGKVFIGSFDGKIYCFGAKNSSIFVSSVPTNAEIYLDGIHNGTTPKTITNVSIGPHTIEVSIPDYYKDYSTDIIVSTGETTEISANLALTNDSKLSLFSMLALILFVVIGIVAVLRKKKEIRGKIFIYITGSLALGFLTGFLDGSGMPQELTGIFSDLLVMAVCFFTIYPLYGAIAGIKTKSLIIGAVCSVLLPLTGYFGAIFAYNLFYGLSYGSVLEAFFYCGVEIADIISIIFVVLAIGAFFGFIGSRWVISTSDKIGAERNKFNAKINAWESEGYNVQSLRKITSSGIKTLKLKKELNNFERKIGVLKELEKELNTLNTEEFDSEANAIRSKLKNPDKISELKEEIAALKKKIEKRKKALNSIEKVETKIKDAEKLGINIKVPKDLLDKAKTALNSKEIEKAFEYATESINKTEEIIEFEKERREKVKSEADSLYEKARKLFEVEYFDDAKSQLENTKSIYDKIKDTDGISRCDELLSKIPAVKPVSELTIKRTIWDPSSKDFVWDAGRPDEYGELPRIKQWLEDKNPDIYWFLLKIENHADYPVTEWNVTLNTEQALTIIEAHIDEKPVRIVKSDFDTDKNKNICVASIPPELGVGIPANGGRRMMYFKMDIRCEDALKNEFGVSGVVKLGKSPPVPIKEKRFTYSCKYGDFKKMWYGSIDELASLVMESMQDSHDREILGIFTNSFRLIRDFEKYCNNRYIKSEKLIDKLEVVYHSLQKAEPITKDEILPWVEENLDAMREIGVEAQKERGIRMCEKLIELLHIATSKIG